MRKGFTLIELLIVIAIIAILATIAIPQFTKYRIRANNAAALSDLRNAVMREELYASDNGAYLYLRTAGYWAPTGEVKLWDAHNNPVDTLHLSRGVAIYLDTDNGVYSTYVALTKHKNGDTYFGAEPDAQGFFFDRDPSYVGKRLKSTDSPTHNPKPYQIDFKPGAGGHNWQRY